MLLRLCDIPYSGFIIYYLFWYLIQITWPKTHKSIHITSFCYTWGKRPCRLKCEIWCCSYVCYCLNSKSLYWLAYFNDMKRSSQKYGLCATVKEYECICLTIDQGYVSLVASTFRFFPHSWFITGFVTGATSLLLAFHPWSRNWKPFHGTWIHPQCLVGFMLLAL